MVEEKEEEITSQDSSPQSEEAIIEPKSNQDEVAPLEKPEDVSEQSSDVDVDKTMSEEQRKAFQEQRLEIKRLKEEMGARKKGESAFDVFRPKSQPGVIDPNSYVNQDTGEMNWISYNQAVQTQAQAVATQTVNEQLDERDARQKFPEVFDDPDLEEVVAGQWLASKFQGKDVSISDLAAKVSKKLSSATTKAEKEGAKKALTELTPKEQASLSVQSQSSATKQASADEEETLKLKARNGDQDALAKLMGSVAWKQ